MVRSSKGRGVIFRVALLHAVGLFFCAEAKIAGFAAGRGRPQTRAFSKGAGFLTFLKKRIYMSKFFIGSPLHQNQVLVRKANLMLLG